MNLEVSVSCELVQAYKQYKKGRSLEIVDPSLAASTEADQITKCIRIGLLCVQADPKLRPDIGRVVVMLSKKPGSLDDQQISLPGLPRIRNRRSHRPPGFSASTSDSQSPSHSTFASSGKSVKTSTTTSTSTTPTIAAPPVYDPRGKRPMTS